MKLFFSSVALSLVFISTAFAAPEAKPVVADAKPADVKPADIKPVAPVVAELAERVIEKTVNGYWFRITYKSGSPRVGRVIDARVDLNKILDIPDPQMGDRMPLGDSPFVVSVQPPVGPADKKGVPPSPPAPTTYSLYPTAAPGVFAFHFTPTQDGVYDLSFQGKDVKSNPDEPVSFEGSFKIGVGLAVPQTEMTQGTGGSRRGSRKVIGSASTEKSNEEKVREIMHSIGDSYQETELLIKSTKGANPELSASLRALSALFEKTKGLAPKRDGGASGHFDSLATTVIEKLEAMAKTAEGKDAKAQSQLAANYADLEMNSCAQCHALYRYSITKNVGNWPKFELKPAKK